MLPAPFFCASVLGLLLATSAVPVLAHVAAPPPPVRSVLLPDAQAAAVVQQCSRAVPRITATWIPKASDIRRLESDLKHLKGQRANACCSPSAQMDDAQKYFRQYAGVVRNGRRLIYVNGFMQPPANGPDGLDWKHTPVIACDGGTSFWGVLYDPATRVFTQLAFNGSG